MRPHAQMIKALSEITAFAPEFRRENPMLDAALIRRSLDVVKANPHILSRRFRALACVTLLLIAAVARPADDGDHGKLAFARTAKSGPWSAAATWEAGRIPATGDRVQIRPGHDVVYDISAPDVIRMIHVAGKLSFARDRNTLLNVGLILVQPGESATETGFDCDAHLVDDGKSPQPVLEIGSPNAPIEADHTARVRLHYVAGMDKESCPAIVCCGGRMDLHGVPLNRTWVKLGSPAKAGDLRIELAEAVTG
jgi:G8 domain